MLNSKFTVLIKSVDCPGKYRYAGDYEDLTHTVCEMRFDDKCTIERTTLDGDSHFAIELTIGDYKFYLVDSNSGYDKYLVK